MTEEDLLRFIAADDRPSLVEALAPLDEAARKKLSKISQDTYWKLKRGEIPDGMRRGFLDRARSGFGAGPDAVFCNKRVCIAALAVVGLGPLSVAKRVRFWWWGDGPRGELGQVLADRRPDWLDEWLAFDSQRDEPALTFPALRALIRAGICERPTTEGYIRQMSSYIGQVAHDRDDRVPVSRKLLDDPDLLEVEVWKMFETEGAARWIDWNQWDQDESYKYETWPRGLHRLCAEGHLDRDRLLDASLDGLSSGIPPVELGGLRKFHLSLEPSTDYVASRESRYRALLSSPVSHVIGFALKQLRVLEKAKRLDEAAFLDEVGGVFNQTTKGAPSTALGMIDRIAKRSPALGERCGEAALGGLIHPVADVQEKAVGVLERVAPEAGEEFRARLPQQAEHVAGSLRSRIAALGSVPTEETESKPDGTSRLLDLEAQIATLPPEIVHRAGISQVAEATELPPSYTPDLVEIAVTEISEPIKPISDVDTLLDAVAHALEEVDSADELERILDGVSRLCDQEPSDFEARSAPLLQRIQKPTPDWGGRGISSSRGQPYWALQDLVRTWVLRKRVKTEAILAKQAAGPIEFLASRASAISDRVARGIPAPLLAAPTHRGGWIAPAALVERMHALQAADLDVAEPDFVQALLRLAPDERTAALEAAHGLYDEPGRILRWALGASEAPEPGARNRTYEWMAAAHARATLDAGGPSFDWTPHSKRPLIDLSPHAHPLPTGVEAPATVDASRLPTLMLHRAGWPYAGYSSWNVGCLAAVWPGCSRSYFLAGAQQILLRIDGNAASTSPSHAWLEPLFDPTRPWNEAGLLALVLGLCSKDADLTGVAVDAMIEGIELGRAHPDPLGDALADLAGSEWCPPNRYAETLGQIARVGLLNAAVVAGILERVVAGVNAPPRRFHLALQLLLDLLSELGRGVADEARPALEAIPGNGKAAKIAKRILALPESGARSRMSDAIADAVEARLRLLGSTTAGQAGSHQV